MQPCVYIMTSRRHGTLYIGVTSDLAAREWQHYSKTNPDSFTAKYGVNRLVWYQEFETMPEAIAKEKALKRWNRQWKIDLIEKTNPHWHPINPDSGELMHDGDWGGGYV